MCDDKLLLPSSVISACILPREVTITLLKSEHNANHTGLFVLICITLSTLINDKHLIVYYFKLISTFLWCIIWVKNITNGIINSSVN